MPPMSPGTTPWIRYDPRLPPTQGSSNSSNSSSDSNPSSLMAEAMSSFEAARRALEPENIVVNGEPKRWPSPEGVHTKVLEKLRKDERTLPRWNIVRTLINERRGFGNCAEMSTFVLRSLVNFLWTNQMFDTRVDTIVMGPHQFTAINPPQPDGKGDYPNKLSEWPENSFIVDPWLGIACPARQYPDMLNSMAADWHRQGKTIGVSVVKGGKYLEAQISPLEMATRMLGASARSATEINRLDGLKGLREEIEFAVTWVENAYKEASGGK